MPRTTRILITLLALFAALPAAAAGADQPSALWSAFDQTLAKARYIDLTHTLTPGAPVWKGFGPATFAPTLNPETGNPYTYGTDGFEPTAYQLTPDQFGTQLDPPAHWAP